MKHEDEPPDPPGAVSDQNGEEGEAGHEQGEFGIRRDRLHDAGGPDTDDDD
jgi:hypothetical protein